MITSPDKTRKDLVSQQQILGLTFFDGSAAQAVDLAMQQGGLIVMPSATCFAIFRRDEIYREAMIAADLVLPDSGFMSMLWRLIQGRRINRISGLAYSKQLLAQSTVRLAGETFWIFPNERAQEKAITWLEENGFQFNVDNCYVAPIYGASVKDEELVQILNVRRPHHVIIGLAGGVQEKLGLFLRDRATYRPAIHCVGGALGLLTGDQVTIPDWADRFYLGWLFRLLAEPRRFLPRLWRARELPWLLLRHGRQMPPMRSKLEIRK